MGPTESRKKRVADLQVCVQHETQWILPWAMTQSEGMSLAFRLWVCQNSYWKWDQMGHWNSGNDCYIAIETGPFIEIMDWPNLITWWIFPVRELFVIAWGYIKIRSFHRRKNIWTHWINLDWPSKNAMSMRHLDEASPAQSCRWPELLDLWRG